MQANCRVNFYSKYNFSILNNLKFVKKIKLMIRVVVLREWERLASSWWGDQQEGGAVCSNESLTLPRLIILVAPAMAVTSW